MKMFTSNPAHQSGYTLLEMLIVGTIGLILLLGVMQIYLSASRTNTLQSAVIEIQDGGRFALAYLEKDLQRAGWSNVEPGINLGTLDSHIDFAQTTNGTGHNASDSLAVRYEADGETGVDVVFTCDGVATPAGEVIVNQYTVQNGVLLCNGREILQNVESFQILYGVENPATTIDGIVDGYVRADQIAGYEELVANVRIGILINSTGDVLQEDNANSYAVLDTIYPAQDDRRLRRLFVKTIGLPNRPKAF